MEGGGDASFVFLGTPSPPLSHSTSNIPTAADSITEVTRALGGSTYIPNTFTCSPACVANYKGFRIADANAITYAGAYANAYADADASVNVCQCPQQHDQIQHQYLTRLLHQQLRHQFPSHLQAVGPDCHSN
jgi:hypothetical protein